MSRTMLLVLAACVPLTAIGSGATGLVERVPMLPATIVEARSGLAELESQAAALQRDIETAEAALESRQEEAFAASQQRAEQQQKNLESLTGMSAEEMETADEDEIMSNMMGAMGMSMADMEALEDMDDAEMEAYFAAKQPNTEGLQDFASSAPQSADPARLQRLSQEFGDWQSGYAERAVAAPEQLKALQDRWAQDHATLESSLDAEMAPKVASVATVDCGEAGEYQDAKALHAISLERADAHTQLAPEHLQQGIEFLSARREAVAADAAFADRFAADATGVDEMAVQSITVQQTALEGISELLNQTLEINRRVLGWVERKDQIASSGPKSTCG